MAAVGILLATTTVSVDAAKTNQVAIAYELPRNATYKTVRAELQKRRVLERLQAFLSPIRLPRTVTFVLAECGGDPEAFYGDNKITICYELVKDLFDDMPAKTTPAGIAPFDTVVGPFVDTCLHEFSHAIFDILKIPVLGREEDAADQAAAYIYLQLDPAEASRLVAGAIYRHLREADSDDAAVTREEFDEDFAEEHSTPKQRAYNLMCIAYGADPKRFEYVVSKGHLPTERAQTCEEEYERVQDAFEKLILPHIDVEVMDRVMKKTWLRRSTGGERRAWRGSQRRR